MALQPFRGAGACQVCVLVSVCVKDTWLKLALGMQGTRAGIPAAVPYPPNLLTLKLELQKLLISLF